MLALLTYRLTYYVPHFGMRTYKKVGSDPELLACYQVYQRFSTTLKLDWLFQLQLLAYVLLGTAVPSWQWVAAMAVQLPLALAWLPIGLTAARRERVALMLLLLLVGSVQPPLYAAQLLTLPPSSEAVLGGVAFGNCTQRLREHTFPFGSGSLNALYLLALATRLVLLSSACLVRANFGRGLLTRVHCRRGQGDELSASTVSSASGSGVRASLDGLMALRQPVSAGCLGHAPSLCSVAADDAEACGGAYVSADALPSLAGGKAPAAAYGAGGYGSGPQSSLISRQSSQTSQSSGGPAQRLTLGSGSAGSGWGSQTGSLSGCGSSFSAHQQPRDDG